jgi:hypothetical protein
MLAAINIERSQPEIARCALQLRETVPQIKHYLTGEGIQISELWSINGHDKLCRWGIEIYQDFVEGRDQCLRSR